jgi:hypothetical protein
MHDIKGDDFSMDLFEVYEEGSEPEISEPQVTEPVKDIKDKPSTPPMKPQAFYREIPPGSAISVKTTEETGPVWRLDNGVWVSAPAADGVVLNIRHRVLTDGEWLLVGTPDDSITQWCVREQLVLSGHFKLLTIPEDAPTRDENASPDVEPLEIEDPDAAKKALLEATREKLKEYAVKSKEACKATKDFNKLKKVNYDEVLACIQACGLLNEDEKSKSAESRILYEEGYKFEAYLTNDSKFIDYDVDKIAAWLAMNSQDNPSYKKSLYTAVDIEAYKKLVDDGFIPTEVVKQFQDEKTVEGQWKLRVDVDETQK